MFTNRSRFGNSILTFCRYPQKPGERKRLAIGGPILLPPVADLPHLARPHTAGERKAARRLANKYGQPALEETAPTQMVGSGANLNETADNGVARLWLVTETAAEGHGAHGRTVSVGAATKQCRRCLAPIRANWLTS
jgi:hypothetical protein